MPFEVGDRVQVASSLADRGATTGWIGYVTEQFGGPQGPAYHRVTRPYGEGGDQGDAVLEEGEIDVLVPGAPIYQVGQSVALMGEAGVITALDGDLATVEIWVELTARRWRGRGRSPPKGRVSYQRVHEGVPTWRLSLEN